MCIDLPNEGPIGDIRSTPFDVFLPTKQDCEMLRKDFVVLISRVLVQYVPELKQYADVVPLHIPHEMSSELAKKSEIVRDACQLSCIIYVQCYSFTHHYFCRYHWVL